MASEQKDAKMEVKGLDEGESSQELKLKSAEGEIFQGEAARQQQQPQPRPQARTGCSDAQWQTSSWRHNNRCFGDAACPITNLFDAALRRAALRFASPWLVSPLTLPSPLRSTSLFFDPLFPACLCSVPKKICNMSQLITTMAEGGASA